MELSNYSQHGLYSYLQLGTLLQIRLGRLNATLLAQLQVVMLRPMNLQAARQDMLTLLQQITAGAAVRDVACEWIRNNRDRWEKWLPVDTQCPGS